MLGAIVKSEHNKKYLQFAFPNLPVFRVVNGIDAQRFRFVPATQKKRRIACLPSKGEMDLTQVIHLVEARARQGLNSLAAVEWAHLKNMTEAEVAAALQDALCLVFLSTHEGIGRLPLEAMLSGAVLACYAAGPVPEYASEDVAITAQVGDIPSLVAGIERIATWHSEGDPRLQQMMDRARAVAGWHSMERETETVLEAWRHLLPE